MDASILTQQVAGLPVWFIGLAAAVLLARPAMIVLLPDDICGPGGWLIDTDEGGWFGCDSDADGGDGD